MLAPALPPQHLRADRWIEALADSVKVDAKPNKLAVPLAPGDGARSGTAVVGRSGLSQAWVSKQLKLLTIAAEVKGQPEGGLVFDGVMEKAVVARLEQAETALLAGRRQRLDALAAIG